MTEAGRDLGEYDATAKLFYHTGNIALIKEGSFREALPVTAQLAPTLYCNFKCSRCSYGQYKTALLAREKANVVHMNWPTMVRCVDGLAEGGVKAVVFSGGGEPSINRNTIPGMQRAKDKGLEIGLFTNGSVYSSEQWDQILDLEPTFIRISLDAGSPQVHHLLHGYHSNRDYFKRTVDNLYYVAKERQRRRIPSTIGVGVSIEPVNLDDLPNVADLVRQIDSLKPEGGLDYVVFRPVVNFVGGRSYQNVKEVADYIKIHRPEYYDAYLAFINQGEQLPPGMMEQANAIISDRVVPTLSASGTRVINIKTKMHGINDASHPFDRCRAASWYPFIGPDGSVYNCVDLAFDSRTVIGNITTQTVEEIWKSPRRREVMDYIDTEGLVNLCPPVCVCYEMNGLFAKIARALQGGAEERMKTLSQVNEAEEEVQARLKQGTNIQPHHNFI